MKSQQDYFSGMIRVRISGKLIEPFLHACTRRGCQLTNLKRVTAEEIIMTVRLKDWKTVRALRRKYRCKLTIVEGKGFPFFIKSLLRKTSLLTAFAAAVMLVFLLANTLWSVKVEGLNPELEASVEEKLKSYGVSPGKLMIGMKDPNEIQRLLLDDISELLWVGVKKQGTSYHLYGVEKTIQDRHQIERPSNLVAVKKGMVIKSFIKKGRPLVSVYDVVEKGQVLAAGQLVEDGDKYVSAEGKVIAETWYKVEQKIPKSHILSLTPGAGNKDYHLVLGEIRIPLWGWWDQPEGDVRREQQTTEWQLFGWKLPFQLQTTFSYQINHKEYKASMKKLMELGKETAEESLLQRLETEAEIKDEKILHQGEENGKVKLILLIKVYENIAETKYISQGD